MIPILFAVIAAILSILYATSVLTIPWWIILIIAVVAVVTYVVPSILIRKSKNWATIEELVALGKKEKKEKRIAKKTETKEKRQEVIAAIKGFFQRKTKEESIEE